MELFEINSGDWILAPSSLFSEKKLYPRRVKHKDVERKMVEFYPDRNHFSLICPFDLCRGIKYQDDYNDLFSLDSQMIDCDFFYVHSYQNFYRLYGHDELSNITAYSFNTQSITLTETT